MAATHATRAVEGRMEQHVSDMVQLHGALAQSRHDAEVATKLREDEAQQASSLLSEAAAIVQGTNHIDQCQ